MGCSGFYQTTSDIVVGQMSHANQVDIEVLSRLESTAERVARGDADRAHLRRPAAQYLSRALIPSTVMTARSLGRISFGREHEHKPGIVVFLPGDKVDLDKLRRLNRSDMVSPPATDTYRDLETGSFREIKRIARAITEIISDEIEGAKHIELGDEGRICNHMLPTVIYALEHLTHVYVRWRGPGSEGRVQIDENLEGVRGFAAWIPPLCLPPHAKPEDIARVCGAEKQGRSIALEGLEI